MLPELLDQISSRIAAINPEQEAPRLLQELKRVRPDVFKTLKENVTKAARDAGGSGITPEQAVAAAERAIALGLLKLIKDIPAIVQTMASAVTDSRTNPAVRCATTGMLAYLVHPRDLIPDDAPGGYGFLDDAILLRAALVEYLNVVPTEDRDGGKEPNYLAWLTLWVPQSDWPTCQSLIIGIQTAFQILSQMPAELLDFTTQALIQNPYMGVPQMTANVQPANPYQMPSVSDIGYTMGGSTASWDGNVSVEFSGGGGVMMSADGDVVSW
jgi:uncharacterized membrane protein YkvA (DUF1232 family)